MKTIHPYLDSDIPMVLAHRGDSAHAPANTMPAFVKAVEAGADALETDIHWTKDGHIVVCHDDVVDWVSDGTGAIRDKTLDELKQLDFGYRFTPDSGQTHPYRGQGVTIVTLRELLCEFPTVRVNMDVKPKEPVSLKSLIAEIYQCEAEFRVLVASFHQEVLQRFRQMNARIATSAAVSEVARFWLRVQFNLKPSHNLPYQALQVPNKASRLKVVTPRFVKAAHASSQKVHVWTVDDEWEMKQLLALGVDGIVTNDPQLAVRVRDQQLLSQAIS